MGQNVDSLIVNIGADVSQFESALNAAISQLNQFNNAISNASGSNGVGGLDSSLNNLNDTTKQSKDHIGGFSDLIKGMGINLPTKVMEGLGMVIREGAEFAWEAAQAYGDLEWELKQAAVLAGGDVTANFNTLEKAALELGGSTIFTAEQVAGAFAEMGRQGFDTAKSVETLPAIIDAATASSEDLGLVTQVTISAMNQFANESLTAAEVTDKLAMGANLTAAGIQDYQYALQYAGATASSVGVEFDELVGMIGLLRDNGIQASSAGTGLRSMMLSLVNPTDVAQEALAGINLEFKDFYTSEGELKSIAEVVDILGDNMQGLSDVEQTELLAKIFGKTAAPTVLSLISSGGDAVREITGEIANSQGEVGRQAEAMMDTFNGSMLSMQGAWEGFKDLVGTKSADTFRPVIDGVSDMLSAVNEGMLRTNEIMEKGFIIDFDAEPVLTGLDSITDAANVTFTYWTGMGNESVTGWSIHTQETIDAVVAHMGTSSETLATLVSGIHSETSEEVTSIIEDAKSSVTTWKDEHLAVMNTLKSDELSVIEEYNSLVGAENNKHYQSMVDYINDRYNENTSNVEAAEKKILELIEEYGAASTDRKQEIADEIYAIQQGLENDLVDEMTISGDAQLKLLESYKNQGTSIAAEKAEEMKVSYEKDAMAALTSEQEKIRNQIAWVEQHGANMGIAQGEIDDMIAKYADESASLEAATREDISNFNDKVDAIVDGSDTINSTEAKPKTALDELEEARKEMGRVGGSWDFLKKKLSSPLKGIVNIVQQTFGGGGGKTKNNASGGIFGEGTLGLPSGIYNTPTLSADGRNRIGENGAEALIPLNNASKVRPFARAIVKEMGGAGTGGGGSANYEGMFNGATFIWNNKDDIRKAAEEFAWQFQREGARLG